MNEDLQDTLPESDNAVAQDAAYTVVRRRLSGFGDTLRAELDALNHQRLKEFGESSMRVSGRTRIRTEHNCVARDIVQVGQDLLFGYNVFIGLKNETSVEDVFSLNRLVETEAGFEIQSVPLTGTFLADAQFQRDFTELYRYYKKTRLIKLTHQSGKLLAGFQIGEQLSDIRVFRWSVSSDEQSVSYIDNRGERDFELPPAYDFVWQTVQREDQVEGARPYVNILDTLFVDNLEGHFSIRVEDNTETGVCLFQEKLEDSTQSLDDARIGYSDLGGLIVLKVLPYRENLWRYYVFIRKTQTVLRLDAIGQSCVKLPEDHGIIFPGGIVLGNGQYKRFDQPPPGLLFKRFIKSPNGEDVLYVFYEPEAGLIGLFPYNMITRELQNPIFGHGYALSSAGQILIFNAENEPTRVHPVQVWHSPFQSAHFASEQPQSQTVLGKIGNPELVRGISDGYNICTLIDNQSASVIFYEQLLHSAQKIFDDHYWVETFESMAQSFRDIAQTVEHVIDEFEKVEAIKQKSAQALDEAQATQHNLLAQTRSEGWSEPEPFIAALARLRQQRGHLITLESYRYMDLEAVGELKASVEKIEHELVEKTVQFLSEPKAFSAYVERVTLLEADVQAAEAVCDLTPLLARMDQAAHDLDALTATVSELEVSDAVQHTRVIDAVSEVYASLNQVRAKARKRKQALGEAESIDQFAAQSKLFDQAVSAALGMCDSIDACEEHLARLLVQLEVLESKFGEHEAFLSDILEKRESVYESFEALKQRLLEARSQRAHTLSVAAARIVETARKRSLKFTEADALNTFFATDATINKAREIIQSLYELDASVAASELESKLKSIEDQAVRQLRDKSDLYAEGGQVIRLGPRHQFSVNTQALDVTLLVDESTQRLHVVGTDYRQSLDDERLLNFQPVWSLALSSESPQVSRAEYLVYQILQAVRTGESGELKLSKKSLEAVLPDPEALLGFVRKFMAVRYREGYQKGIHDSDAARILSSLWPRLEQAGPLLTAPASRALAQLFWANNQHEAEQNHWRVRAQSAKLLVERFSGQRAMALLIAELGQAIGKFFEVHCAPVTLDSDAIAHYLAAELSQAQLQFVRSDYAEKVVSGFSQAVSIEVWQRARESLTVLKARPCQQMALAMAWIESYLIDSGAQELMRYAPEAALLLIVDSLPRQANHTALELSIDGLLSDHPRISSGILRLSIDDFLERLRHHSEVVVPQYLQYHQYRQALLVKAGETLRLEEFEPKPLSSFVRNRLVNECFLPLIGDNFAKQMGTIGKGKRTDSMGLLMMISPPGYGKTTLMEYVANRLGLIFMKINCPSIGHGAHSLDPAQAPDSSAQRELEKINLAFEMGNNVMLYLDDIQHTHPEFLQKFISLCDGTRRIEGIWQGQAKTYDMRGKKFCVVMAGNPYTESGEAFKVPDMLANRADVYNLGDILGGMSQQFALSYIENSLTSNAVLAPLAIRPMSDVYILTDWAQAKRSTPEGLSYGYSQAELTEIKAVLERLFVIRDLLLKVNAAYIASAAQDERARSEPPFKLQGSYRNMNKMAEKVTSVMTTAELSVLIEDHYRGEAQLLTKGAEANLLKLAEIRGTLTPESTARWSEIKESFVREKALGGEAASAGERMVVQLHDITKTLRALSEGVVGLNSLAAQKSEADNAQHLEINAHRQARLASQTAAHKDVAILQANGFKMLAKTVQQLSQTLLEHKPEVDVKVVNQPVPGIDKVLNVMAETLETAIFPLVRSLEKKYDIDLRNNRRLALVTRQLRDIQQHIGVQPSD